MLTVFAISGVRAFGRATVREPVYRFIDFYIAAQKTAAPLSLWERIVYGIALARTAPPAAAQQCE